MSSTRKWCLVESAVCILSLHERGFLFSCIWNECMYMNRKKSDEQTRKRRERERERETKKRERETEKSENIYI